ncbi:MAG: hypothetical protein IJO00_03255 [Clostridia bacterium]|nr:hypothetical protein [Clostridia bacterium]
MLIIIGSFTMLASIICSMIVNNYTETSEDQLSSTSESIKYLSRKE